MLGECRPMTAVLPEVNKSWVRRALRPKCVVWCVALDYPCKISGCLGGWVGQSRSILQGCCVHADRSPYSLVLQQMSWTPLHAASAHGHTEIVKLLVEARAPLETKDKVPCAHLPLHQLPGERSQVYRSA